MYICCFSLYMRSSQKVTSHVIWKIETFIEEDTRYKKYCIQDNDASVPFKVGTLGPHTASPHHHQVPCCIFLNLIDGLKSLPFLFSFGKSHKLQGTRSELKCSWDTWVIWCFAKKLCTRCNAWAGALLWWSGQSLVAHSCGLLSHPNSFHGGMFKLNAKFDANLLLCSLSHFVCNDYTVHMLTQQHPLTPLTSTRANKWMLLLHSSAPWALLVLILLPLHKSPCLYFWSSF